MELSEEDNNVLLQSLNNLFPKESNNEEYNEQIIMVEADDQVQEVVVEVSAPRKPKQARKQKIVLRPINDDEMDLQIIEETPETEIKPRPRREYRTKKRMERLPMKSPTSCRMEVDESNGTQKHNHNNSNNNNNNSSTSTSPVTKTTSENHKTLNDSNNINNHNDSLAMSINTSTIKIESSTTPDQTTPSSDNTPRRRTRLSNTCRVATGKSYVCHNCDFSTDRINNIIIHLKECCPT